MATAYKAVEPYMPVIYSIVEAAAAATPNKTDDEIVNLSYRLGVPELWGDRSKEEVIRSMVAAAAKEALPDVPDSVLNTAIEAAYLAIKNKP